MTQLTHVEMQDRLSWCSGLVHSPVWRQSLRSTQRLPVMGLAARATWISHGISHGNMVESGTLRGRGTVPGFDGGTEGMRMLPDDQVHPLEQEPGMESRMR